MHKLLVFLTLILLTTLSWSSTPTTPTGILLDTPWKISLQTFAVKNVIHPSWGYSHSERNYHNTKWIAHKEGLEVDEDVLFASAFLHDVGGLPPFEQKGVDHGLRSAQVGIPLLRSWGFPEEKLSHVEKVIVGHIYYGAKPSDPLAQAFRDADMLDFLGAMGVARILAATTEMGTYPTIKNSYNSLQSLAKKLPVEFSYSSSKTEGMKRLVETQDFLQKLKKYSFKETAY
jgi:uncharacterized protein